MLFIPKRKIHKIRHALHIMRKKIIHDIRIPQRAGYAGNCGKEIGMINGIHRKQTGKRVACKSTPCRLGCHLFFHFRHDLFGKKTEICVCSACERRIVLKDRRNIPRRHIVVPIQPAYCNKRSICMVLLRQDPMHLLPFVRKGMEIDHRRPRVHAGVNRYRFVFNLKNIHTENLFAIQLCILYMCVTIYKSLRIRTYGKMQSAQIRCNACYMLSIHRRKQYTVILKITALYTFPVLLI